MKAPSLSPKLADEVKKALGASWYEVLPSKEFYASGRAKLIVDTTALGTVPGALSLQITMV